MVLNSLAGLPAFLVYFCLAAVLTGAYITIYMWITPHDEFALLRANNPAAAISLGFSMIGFALPLTSSIGHSDGVGSASGWRTTGTPAARRRRRSRPPTTTSSRSR